MCYNKFYKALNGSEIPMRKNMIIICLSAIIIFITAFAFYNSGKSFKTTHAESEAVVEVINPVIQKNEISVGQEALRLYIRKVAHVIEFAVLGAAVMLLTMRIKYQYGRSLFGFAFFYVLAVGTADEFIQSLRDRSSLVSDVLLDFAGAMIGFLMAFLAVKISVFIARKIKSKREESRCRI